MTVKTILKAHLDLAADLQAIIDSGDPKAAEMRAQANKLLAAAAKLEGPAIALARMKLLEVNQAIRQLQGNEMAGRPLRSLDVAGASGATGPTES